MDPEAIMAELQQAFRKTFLDPSLVVGPETTSADVDGWDSLSHVRLLLMVERQFRIRISAQEGSRLRCVGDLAALVARKLEP